MKNFISFFRITLILLSFTCCKKETLHTAVKGVVADKTNCNALPNAAVYLLEGEVKLIYPYYFYIAIDSTVTNNNGEFSFDLTAKKGMDYAVTAMVDKYYYLYDTEWIFIAEGKANYVVIGLQPEAFLKIHIKNTQPYDFNDLITIGGDWNNTAPHNYYGIDVDTFVVNINHIGNANPVSGNNNVNIIWWITKNNIETEHSDSVYCLAFDTTVYEINY